MSFSIVFSPPVLLRRWSDTTAWWAPGGQPRSTHHNMLGKGTFYMILRIKIQMLRMSNCLAPSDYRRTIFLTRSMILAEHRPKNCCSTTLASYWMKSCSPPKSFQLTSFHLLHDTKRFILSQSKGPVPYFH